MEKRTYEDYVSYMGQVNWKFYKAKRDKTFLENKHNVLNERMQRLTAMSYDAWLEFMDIKDYQSKQDFINRLPLHDVATQIQIRESFFKIP